MTPRLLVAVPFVLLAVYAAVSLLPEPVQWFLLVWAAASVLVGLPAARWVGRAAR